MVMLTKYFLKFYVNNYSQRSALFSAFAWEAFVVMGTNQFRVIKLLKGLRMISLMLRLQVYYGSMRKECRSPMMRSAITHFFSGHAMAIAFINSKNLSAAQDLQKIGKPKFQNKWEGASNNFNQNKELLRVIDSRRGWITIMGVGCTLLHRSWSRNLISGMHAFFYRQH